MPVLALQLLLLLEHLIVLFFDQFLTVLSLLIPIVVELHILLVKFMVFEVLFLAGELRFEPLLGFEFQLNLLGLEDLGPVVKG